MSVLETRFLSKGLTTAYVTFLLGSMSTAFSALPRIHRQLKGKNGTPYKASFLFQTFDESVSVSAVFDKGRMSVRPWRIDDPDITMFFRNQAIMRDLLSAHPKRDIFNAMLDGDMVYEGNLNHLARFSFLTTEFIKPKPGTTRAIFTPPSNGNRKARRIAARPMKPHPGVQFLTDPAFSDRTIDDWPQIKSLWEKHFTTRPAICAERARLLTEFFSQFGFETDSQGKQWDESIRQGRALRYILLNKEARVQPDDLLLGTTTSHPVGVQMFPEFVGLTLWPELNTITTRKLNPYDLDPKTRQVLNEEVFPFWIDRNIREVARRQNGNPECQRLEERWVLYFMWKVAAISHTIPDFPTVLEKGLEQIRNDALARVESSGEDSTRNFHQAVACTIDGVLNYANRLADKAERTAESLDPKTDKRRIDQLCEMARRVRQSPAKPARNLAEAINAIWIVWVCLHQENMNAGLSLGRLDQWLQPYFAHDMEAAKTRPDRAKVLDDAIALCAALFLKCQDHLPMVPDLANRLFGGSSSDQVITVGGQDSQGNCAVNDMTYLLLKVTEMLGMRDPNVNARYAQGVNPKEYLRRLVEVNAITGATPSLHNDAAVIASLLHQGFSLEHARDWSATGCVEPTSCGRHMGHTNCMLLKLIDPLEITLNNGTHPLIGQVVGAKTGNLRGKNAPKTFEAFFDLYKRQLRRMINHAIDYNNQLGRVHQQLHPTPLLSSMIQGTAESGKDVTRGGATYNSSGAALVALTDVVDSLMTIKTLIYDKPKVTWPQLLDALEADFEGHEKLYAIIQHKVPKFGGADTQPRDLAQELIDFIYNAYHSRKNYRGGRYTAGFWSMSNHVAFGVLSGALPSGRKKGKAFTPGITPSADASGTLLDPIHAVGSLDPLKMPNNIAFNVKLFPAPGEPGERFVDHATDLAESYVKLGGMQMQFNVVTSETLRDAMENPAGYRNLLVRISGYNAYFVELNRDMQIELIERAEFTV